MRHVLYPGEINDGQREDTGARDRSLRRRHAGSIIRWRCFLQIVPARASGYGVQMDLAGMKLVRPRRWEAYWLAFQIYPDP